MARRLRLAAWLFLSLTFTAGIMGCAVHQFGTGRAP